MFERDKPADDAALLMREATQNSWDSALEMRAELAQNSRTPPPQFTLTYRFVEVDGKRKHAIVDALGLRELNERRLALEAQDRFRSELGLLAENDCLDALNSNEPLRLLQINESGAGGMFGNWKNGPSKLHHALCSIGMTEKPDGSGGSFGYGKAGFIRGSRIRTAVAYTCFGERTEGDYAEPGITRRLLGAVYWGEHELSGTRYEGMARLGEGLEPLNNEDADTLATALGITTRDPSILLDRGTSILLVDPTVNPEDLKSAAERYWWPALEDRSLGFAIDVIGANGEDYEPRPKQARVGSDDLSAFISTYEVATDPATTRDTHPQWLLRSASAPRSSDLSGPVGRLCLTHDAAWAFPQRAADDTEDASLVALIRDPRMVVEYMTYAQGKSPYVRGTFVADPAVNDALALTEPKGHDAWRGKATDSDIAPENTAVAGSIARQIRAKIAELRSRLTPPVDPYDAPKLPAFEELAQMIREGRGGGGGKVRKAKPRPLSINPGDEKRYTARGRQIVGTATIRYSEDPKVAAQLPDSVEIRITVKHEWARYDKSAGDRTGAPVVVNPIPDFHQVSSDPEIYDGTLQRDGEIQVTYETDEYDQPWTGSIIVAAEILGSVMTDISDGES